MKITDVETIILRLPVVAPNGDGLQDVLIVRIHTDAGITGIGEAHTMPLALQAIIEAPVSQFASQGLRQALVGEDPLRVDYLWQKMSALTAVLGRRGLIVHAMSALDVALWDIAGKALNAPIHQLLGGRQRDDVVAYASVLMPESANDLIDSASGLKERGFRAMKFGWGRLGRDVARDRTLLGRIRAEVGDDIELMLDLGIPVRLEAAKRYAEAAAEHGLAFLEEPLAHDDLRGYAALTRTSRVPIATGEKETSHEGFIGLMDRGGVSIIQPDVARAGGITEVRRIAVSAETRGCEVIPHSWATDILLAATLHVLASIRSARFIEYNTTDNPLRSDLLADPIRPSDDGLISVPTGPGLGIELNFDTIEKYRWVPE